MSPRSETVKVRSWPAWPRVTLSTRACVNRLPLLTPMSEVAGRMSIQEGAKYLERPQMGRGILLGGVPGVPPANITILGGGVVGANAAKIAAGFGMDIYAFDPFLSREDIESKGVKAVETAEELYKTCQYVSLHIPANEHTKNSIGYDLLSLMPQGGTLVNTARKEVIHEDELLRMMDERSDFRYVSDIAPDCKDVFTEKYEGRYYFTPKKMGAQTAEANINAGVAAARQIVDFIENGNTKFKVN